MIDDPALLAAVAGTFLLAGMVKGVIGLGLPTISLAILTATLDLASAMALLLIPSFVTNLWQGLAGGRLWEIIRRLWPFLLPATVLTVVGGRALDHVDHGLLSLLLGVLVAAYALVGLIGWRLSITPAQDRWAGPLFGTVNGVLTGMTGSFVVPGVLYLNALGLGRDMLVQAMGVCFTLATAALALTLQQSGLLTADLGLGSLIGLPPALVGMVLGQRLRRRLSEARFRQAFFWSLLALGAYIVATKI